LCGVHIHLSAYASDRGSVDIGGRELRKAIIGNATDEFTPITETAAKKLIRRLLEKNDILISGGCHLGGVDIWAEEYADKIGAKKIIHYPKVHRWSGGYRERNLKIAKDADIVYVIVVSEYPPKYGGRRFRFCYHCDTTNHVKSGACWTAWKAIAMGKKAVWFIIQPDGSLKKEVPFVGS